ncbi:hypothetical protein EZV62_005223 [Acer yangbiense]|uniref:BRCT domain-containing protein n=1 Tax=Acer yangbiense TaxID=1000413 RepID=A0A5C7IMH2_9ROSI|nr:hypothetical protein EZV62_005223 [Acer yangbiense]
MAPKKASSPSPISIGNCEVMIEANKFSCKSDQNMREDMNLKSSNDVCHSISEQKGEEYMFVLVNPKDADSREKSYLQEVLKIYMKELPSMNYAANTGKQSTFLEKCVLNGKYCTLLLRSKPMQGDGEVVAAITYQIVPTDTQYAEVPLAAVISIHQHKGFGHSMYMELRKRLENVGIRSIFCWGDKESEGFWLKQGFVSVAEVDRKGRARRLPIRADIRKALCFPGGSTLMVSHLNRDNSTNTVDSLKFCFPLKPCEKSSLISVNRSVEPESTEECYNNTLKLLNQVTCRTERYQAEQLLKDGLSREETKLGGFSGCLDPVHSCGDPATLEKVQSSSMATDSVKVGPDTDAKNCSCSTQGTKRKVWEASSSSLKSKKVKGSYQVDCQLSSKFVSEDDETLEISGSKAFVEVTPIDPLSSSYSKNVAKDRPICMTSAAPTSKELQSSGECFKIILMNIADDSKKTHLTKVIENLGGIVTSDGSISTHVVTGKVRKTLNFCTALCSGAWIVSPNWLKESFREGRFVDEALYILNDEDYVLKYRTELNSTIVRAKARAGSLLEGYNICMSAHVQPPVKTLAAIVRSAGGNVINRLDKANEASKTIFIACEEDMEEALSGVKKGILTFSSEWLMNCIMKQELDLEAPQFAESL